jgi:hypothetical protein
VRMSRLLMELALPPTCLQPRNIDGCFLCKVQERCGQELEIACDQPIFAPDAEPSRKSEAIRGVRPRHPSRSAARRTGAGSSSGPEPRQFYFTTRAAVGASSSRRLPRDRYRIWPAGSYSRVNSSESFDSSA